MSDLGTTAPDEGMGGDIRTGPATADILPTSEAEYPEFCEFHPMYLDVLRGPAHRHHAWEDEASSCTLM